MWNDTCLHVLDTKSDEFTVIYLHSTVVLLVHLTLVVVEKAIYEAKSVKYSYSEDKTLFSANFIESE